MEQREDGAIGELTLSSVVNSWHAFHCRGQTSNLFTIFIQAADVPPPPAFQPNTPVRAAVTIRKKLNAAAAAWRVP